MSLFSRRALPAGLAELVGRSRVLARATSTGALVVGLADRLIYPSDDGWLQIEWHQVERGGWDRASQQLRWTTVDGDQAELSLDDPGRLPQLFQERVNATVAYTQVVPFDGHRNAVVSARRSLSSPNAPLSWHVSAGKGATIEQAMASPEVAAELERLQRDLALN